jgi:hypothetical protein
VKHRFFLRRAAGVSAAAVFAMLASSCAVTGGGGYGYGYDGGVAVGVDYNEPFGVDYGGWGAGYAVAPFRDGDHRRDGGGGDRDRGRDHPSPRAFHSPPAGRAMPSIPSHSQGRPGGSQRR